MQQRMGKVLSVLVYLAAFIGGGWIVTRFLLPWTAPFLLAFTVAAAMETPVRALVRRGWRRSLASGILTLAVLGILCYMAVQLSVWAVSAVNGFAKEMPVLMTAISHMLDDMRLRFFSYLSRTPKEFSAYAETAMTAIGERFYDLPAILSQWALNFLADAAQSSPDVLLFLVTAGIGSYFISAGFPQVVAFAKAQIPERIQRRWEGMGRNLKEGFGGLVRAQLILMTMTFFQLLLAFFLLDVRRAALLAILTALIDALPVFGTGIVLLPWAAYCLILGEGKRGLGLLICWAGVNLVRNCAQAKLVGDQIGLNPIASLLAVYMGWQIWGVWGMLLFPVIFVLLQQMNCRGVIHIWRSL